MTASEIRRRFLEYFERQGHAVLPSSSLVPEDDPTLLFTNAGMVQFKRIFLGEASLPFERATTSQKCLRVSGKHNDLEEVGRTARHHTFFEMLGNFSFGDYFKRDAIGFAWELLTQELSLEPSRLWATVHYTDDEAAGLWESVAGLPPRRIFRLGDKDNFWQMGETGPCGPCSELHYDLRPGTERGTDLSLEAFVAAGEQGRFLELWNLVFMQYDRGADGELAPLPAPSIDTGAGLERLASVLQGVESNYDTDLFRPLIERAVAVVGREYLAGDPSAVSFRVLADHARAVAFLLADGVFPTNEGRGYVVRRILRRAVRHAWLLGRREPTLVEVVDEVANLMEDAYPELAARREHLLRATRLEEERFLATIDAGMQRLDDLAPPLSQERRENVAKGSAGPPTIDGGDAFRLHDTFGFPLDLTELIARERGYTVDVAGFEEALEEQRERSRAVTTGVATVAMGAAGAETASGRGDFVERLRDLDTWQVLAPEAEQRFVGYRERRADTEVIAFAREDGQAALRLRENPFYVAAGGQISDQGVVEGEGWRLRVRDVRRIAGDAVLIGELEGQFPGIAAPVSVRAQVWAERHDTERNHTATHLLHAALRKTLGPHVVQRGSLVAPDRLRFDFSQPRPMTPDEIHRVDDEVNRAILEDLEVRVEEMAYPDAVKTGAMALFGEKYGDVVRVISVPGVSKELCGGTHVRHTGEIGLFRIVGETGVAAGVRRIEAVTGTAAYRRDVALEEMLNLAASELKTTPEGLAGRVELLIAETKELQRQLSRAREASAADIVGQLLDMAVQVPGAKVLATEVEVAAPEELRQLGDALRQRLQTGVAVLAARYPDKTTLFTVVTDDLVERGVRADEVIRAVAGLTGGSGGGRPHMAQGSTGTGDQSKIREALQQAPALVRRMLSA